MPSGAYSKSMFYSYRTKLEPSVIYPVSRPDTNLSTAYIFDELTLNALREIQQQYTFHLANQSYEQIPTDYLRFLRLYETVENTRRKIKNDALKLLFLITREGLEGAMNAFSLNYMNVELKLERSILQRTIEDILAGINRRTAITADVCGRLTAQQTFTLAPLFSYYIMLYGMPGPGEGFDEYKLAVLLSIFDKNGINPYE